MKKRRIIIYSIIVVFVILILMIPKCSKQADEELSKRKSELKNSEIKQMEKSMRAKILKKSIIKRISRTDYDVYLIMTDLSGNLIWEKRIGTEYFDWGDVVEISSDNTIIVAGKSYDIYGDNSSNFIMEVDMNGKVSYMKPFAEDGFEIKTEDEGFISSGSAFSDEGEKKELFIIKSDKDSKYEWVKSFGRDDLSWGHFAIVTGSGSYVTIGQSENTLPLTGDVIISKKGTSNENSWSKKFGGDEYDWGYGINEDGNGNYMISGMTYSFGAGNNDMYIIKVDSDGNCLLSKTLGGEGFDDAYAMADTEDGFIVAGSSTSFGAGGYDGYVVEIDAQGNCLWARTYGSEKDESLFSVIPVDGGYVFSGVCEVRK